MQHNKLVVQIVRQAKIAEESGVGFGIVFAAMGVSNDVADYFRASFPTVGGYEECYHVLNLPMTRSLKES